MDTQPAQTAFAAAFARARIDETNPLYRVNMAIYECLRDAGMSEREARARFRARLAKDDALYDALIAPFFRDVVADMAASPKPAAPNANPASNSPNAPEPPESPPNAAKTASDGAKPASSAKPDVVVSKPIKRAGKPRGAAAINACNVRQFATYKLATGKLLAKLQMSQLEDVAIQCEVKGAKDAWLCRRIAAYVANPAPGATVEDYITPDVFDKLTKEPQVSA